jgi:hypothetical protein
MEPLKGYILRLLEFAKIKSPDFRRQMAENIRSSTLVLHTFTIERDRFEPFSTQTLSVELVQPKIRLSLIMLGSALEGVMRYALDLHGLPPPSRTYVAPDDIIESLQVSGICPSVVRSLSSTCQADTVYFASTLEPRQVSKSHQECTDHRCVAHNIDPSNYRTKHCTESCGTQCTDITVDVDQICAILRNDQIPLVRLRHYGDSSLTFLEVVAFQGNEKYIAISHVWSDLLGNPAANALPLCSLKNINALVNQAASQEGLVHKELVVSFWMDTLCVPVNGKHRDYRKKAILMMRETYQNAAAVLVLDATLQTSPIPSSVEELYLRVVISGWFCRLWTFQEIALAKVVCISFLDGVVNLDAEEEKDGKHWEDRGLLQPYQPFSNVSYDTHNLLAEARTPIIAIDQGIESSHYRQNLIFAGLRNRTTSKAEDQAVCVATLLRLDRTCMEKILDAQDGERMKVLFSSLAEVPVSLLFSRLPRLQEEGYKWAPRSLLNHAGRLNRLWSQSCLRDDKLGLKLSWPTWRLLSKDCCRGWFDTTKRIFFREEETDRWFMLTKSTTDSDSFEEMEPQALPACHDLAIVSQHWTTVNGNALDNNIRDVVIVSLVKDDKEALHSRFVAIGQLRELVGYTGIRGPVMSMLEWANQTWPFLDGFNRGCNMANRDRIVAQAKRLSYKRGIWIN